MKGRKNMTLRQLERLYAELTKIEKQTAVDVASAKADAATAKADVASAKTEVTTVQKQLGNALTQLSELRVAVDKIALSLEAQHGKPVKS
jgi:chromosome segregation ATPase